MNFIPKRAMLLGVALSAVMVFGGASAARASDWGRSCEERIEHERCELDRAIARHGYYSRQAEHERRELDRLIDQCRYRHYDRDHDRDGYRD